MDKIYETCFQVLHIRQQRTVIPEREKANEVNPMIAPAYCLEFPGWSTGRRNLGGA